jgi:hypothetical protein
MKRLPRFVIPPSRVFPPVEILPRHRAQPGGELAARAEYSFVPRAQIGQRFFDTPYYVTPNYVTPSEPVGQEALRGRFALQAYRNGRINRRTL